MARAKVTGRFETREELCRYVWEEYLSTKRNMSEVGRAARISPAVAQKIINSGEGMPSEEERIEMHQRRKA